MNFIYKNKETDQSEVVTLENWAWAVEYKDKSHLHQFDFSTGEFHRVGEIKQESVKLWALVNMQDTKQHIEIIVPVGARLIHKYRILEVRNGAEVVSKIKMYIFGITYNTGATILNHILPDGRIIQANHELDYKDLSL